MLPNATPVHPVFPDMSTRVSESLAELLITPTKTASPRASSPRTQNHSTVLTPTSGHPLSCPIFLLSDSNPLAGPLQPQAHPCCISPGLSCLTSFCATLTALLLSAFPLAPSSPFSTQESKVAFENFNSMMSFLLLKTHHVFPLAWSRIQTSCLGLCVSVICLSDLTCFLSLALDYIHVLMAWPRYVLECTNPLPALKLCCQLFSPWSSHFWAWWD